MFFFIFSGVLGYLFGHILGGLPLQHSEYENDGTEILVILYKHNQTEYFKKNLTTNLLRNAATGSLCLLRACHCLKQILDQDAETLGLSQLPDCVECVSYALASF